MIPVILQVSFLLSVDTWPGNTTHTFSCSVRARLCDVRGMQRSAERMQVLVAKEREMRLPSVRGFVLCCNVRIWNVFPHRRTVRTCRRITPIPELSLSLSLLRKPLTVLAPTSNGLGKTMWRHVQRGLPERDGLFDSRFPAKTLNITRLCV